MGQKLGSTNVLGGVALNSVAPGRLERIYVIFKVILIIDDWGISCEIALRWM